MKSRHCIVFSVCRHGQVVT